MEVVVKCDKGDRGFDYDFELVIWVHADKTYGEFLESIQAIVDPVKIINGKFFIGEIGCLIEKVKYPAPIFIGLPDVDYQYKIIVDTPGHLIWGGFCRQFAMSLTGGIRTRFESTYLVTNDQGRFVYYSGTNKSRYLNPHYDSWKSGEFNAFKDEDSIEVVECD
jgi:hypothetical protein